MRTFCNALVGVMFCLSAAGISASRADIVNGSFETFATSGPGITPGVGSFNIIYRTGAVGIQGWTVIGQSVDVSGTHFWNPPAGGGSFSMDLVGSEDDVPPGTPQLGGLAQTITGLTAGHTYKVSFDHSVNPGGDGYNDQNKPKILDVTVMDSGNAPLDISATGDAVALANEHVQYTLSNGTRTATDMQWILDSVTFVATGSDAIVQFSAAANPNPALTPNLAGPTLDLVTIVEVPEPATLAIGTVAAALLINKRRR